MTLSAFQIDPARTPRDLDAARALFRAYAASLEIDLSYQGFARELDNLPGAYAPPGGEILLARAADGQAVGCVALRPLDEDGTCEMKRLYVAPEGRGHGLGRRLVEAVVCIAEGIGYREMKLDTLASMEGAQALYRKSGFAPARAYYDTPVAGTLFMARPLKGLVRGTT